MAVTLDGEALSKKEITALLAGTDSLVLLRGQWVEVDRERLERSIQQFREAEELAAREGLSFAEAMRMLAGAAVADEPGRSRLVADWSRVTAGPWLAETLQALRSPDGANADPGPALRGHAAPVPAGRRAVAASAVRAAAGRVPRRRHGPGQDDPGAGAAAGAAQRIAGPASLLVAPASLLANWAAEIERFAPELKCADRASLGDDAPQEISEFTARARGRARSGDHQLRFAAAHPGAVGDRVALRHPGRGAGDQEPGREADARGQGAEGARRASRSPARRSRTASAICGRSSISSIPACSGRRSSSAAMPRCWPIAEPIPTARCASWCGPTSCAG